MFRFSISVCRLHTCKWELCASRQSSDGLQESTPNDEKEGKVSKSDEKMRRLASRLFVETATDTSLTARNLALHSAVRFAYENFDGPM